MRVNLDEFKKELTTIKKNNSNNEVVDKAIINLSDYNYINFTNDSEVDDYLNDKSFKILNLIGGANIHLGSIFIEVQDYLANYEDSDTTYIKWLESNGFNRMTALRYKRRAEIYNNLKSNKAKCYIATVPQRVIDEIIKFNNKDEVMYYLEESDNFFEFETFLKKDIIQEIENNIHKNDIKIKDRIKNLSLKKIEKLDNEKKNKLDDLVRQIEDILKEEM